MTLDSPDPGPWPVDEARLEVAQHELALAAEAVPRWEWPGSDADAGAGGTKGRRELLRELRRRADDLCVAAVFAAFPRGDGGPGRPGQPVVVAAVLWRGGRAVRTAVVRGESGEAYAAGYLALRCGALLEAAVRGLEQRPDVLVVDATGRDHPRRAGLALHLGACLDLPSVGVTNRVLEARYDEPAEAAGSSSPLLLDGELVGYAVRTRAGARPVLAHAAWRTTPDQARDLVLALSGRWRTPLVLRAARTLARLARAGAPPA